MATNWITLTVKDELVAQEGLGLVVGRCLGIFYIDEGIMSLRDPEWIQCTLNILISLFHLYRLVLNVTKTKSITCYPGTHWSRISEEGMGRWWMGGGWLTASNWEDGPPARNAEWNLLKVWWLHTDSVCMGRGQKLTGTGFPPVM